MSRDRPIRASWAVSAAVGLGIALAVGPATASPVAAAAPRLTLAGAASYVVQPEQHRVHVTVDLVATNHATETITTRYTFDRANLAVLPGSTAFRATNDGVKVSVSVASRTAASTLLAIRFAKRLASGRSTNLRLAFDLPDPGGAPSRRVRVGPSLVAFPVWAFGTRGTPGSTVSVKFPSGYQVTVGSGRLGNPVTATDGTTTLSSPSLADPFALSGYVLADRPGAFTESPLDVPLDGVTAHLAIRAWQDDPAWAKRVGALLKKSLPALAATIGLPYPQTSTVVVEETVAPLDRRRGRRLRPDDRGHPAGLHRRARGHPAPGGAPLVRRLGLRRPLAGRGPLELRGGRRGGQRLKSSDVGPPRRPTRPVRAPSR